MKAEEFGKYLKNIRKERKLTIRQLDIYSGVSHSYISQMESGARGIPSPDILQKLAKPLGVTYENLMEKAGYITKEEIFKNAIKEGLVTYDHSELPEEMDDKLVDFIKEMLQDPDNLFKRLNKEDIDQLIDLLIEPDNNEVWSSFANRLLRTRGLDPEKTKNIINDLEKLDEKDIDDVIDFIRYKKSKNDR